MMRVLVVDDNPDYRLLVRLALDSSTEPFELVGEAARAGDGVALARSLQPDVALVDLVLSGADGLDTLAAVRRVAPKAALVGVSAYPESELRGLAHPGSVGYLSKAVRPSRLPSELSLLAGVLGAVETARSTRLDADESSARAARHFVDETLTSWDQDPALGVSMDQVLDVVQLLVSEVVTNAVVHGRSDAEVSVRLLDDRVRVEVVDRGDMPVRRRDAADDETSGRGTALVEALSSGWGIEELPVGKMVWFEVARPDTAA